MPTPIESFNLRDCERCLEEVDQLLANLKFQQTLKENPAERTSIGALLTKINERVGALFPKIKRPSDVFIEVAETVPAMVEEPPHPLPLAPIFAPVEPKGHWEIRVQEDNSKPLGGAPAVGLKPEVARQRKGNYPYAMDERGFILTGPMTGLTIAQCVRCQGCKKQKRVYQTRHWSARNRCEDCLDKTLEKPAPFPVPTAASSDSKRSSGLYRDGIFQGRQAQSLTQCRVCKRREKCYLAKRDGWPEADLCPAHNDPPRHPKMRECEGCHLTLPIAETTHWPLPDICDQCAALTAPEPLSAVPEPPSLPKNEPSPLPAQKPSNPFSRKREFPIGGENNRHQKRRSVEMRMR